MKITAAVLRELNKPLSVEELNLSDPKSNEVLVKIDAFGICHSDYHVVTGLAKQELPVVLGHEGAGTVLEIGDGVTDVEVGQNVLLNWFPYCKQCPQCLVGNTNHCKTYMEMLGQGKMLDGTTRLTDSNNKPILQLSGLACWSTHVVVPDIVCTKMPEETPPEIAALIGCAVTTGVGAVLNQASVHEGSSVVVYGAGGVGLSIIMGCVFAGAEKIIAVDRSEAKETMARSMGATHFIKAGKDMLGNVKELTDGLGADYAFDAVGNIDVAEMLLPSLRERGLALLVGVPPTDSKIRVDATDVFRQEKRLTGTIYGSADTGADFERFARMYLSGLLPIDKLISKHYKIDEINQACEEMLNGSIARGVVIF
ncbi:MAG: alcohol dehydrogenase catalytic domain-containing protein [Acidimicrobiales bacterium]|nr:alcohol dehydrogenase [Acidimicrobiaceae bacterium]MDP6161814.1 alcohol dehydrogenase catalytic domain-containing protein [Acidimicrobiales bacterium]MDP6323167.1 alcohol dehydrogenase catalytic domain-containing protein [Acidimicrobiales bacterium]HJL91615.1 alcohol dehydrogenase catalytic domain-containing protein [Acidimicrobiales bacterium]HJO40010.1 alcohol dehydrogenase catalytic domain-containing protein [Acidimicrobiales bacterium]